MVQHYSTQHCGSPLQAYNSIACTDISGEVSEQILYYLYGGAGEQAAAEDGHPLPLVLVGQACHNRTLSPSCHGPPEFPAVEEEEGCSCLDNFLQKYND